MKSDVLKKVKAVTVPNNILRKKVDSIANQVFSLVNKEVGKYQSIVSIHFGGSYAKETWTPKKIDIDIFCLLYTSPSPRDKRQSRMPSSA